MIPDIEPVNTWSGNSSATRFDFDFLINNASELTVLHTDSNGIQTKLELNTDYTINQIGQEDGSYITFPIVGSTYSVLSSSEKISLLLDIPVAQTSPYGTSSRLDLDSLEYSLDYLTRLIQIQKRQVERSVKVQEGSDISTDTLALNLNKVADISTDVSTVAGSIAEVQNVSSNITNVNNVGNDITNVNAVANDLTNLDAIKADLTNIDLVAGDLTNIDTVAGSIANVNAVGGSISNVNTVVLDLTNIDTVATNIVDVIAVASDISNINAVADDLTNIDSVKADLTNIDTVAGKISNINAVAIDISSVNAVADDLTNIDSVKADLTNIDSVAGNLTNINAVKNNATNINTVAGANSNINTVATNISSITTVESNLTNINAVKNNAANIDTVAGNISNVNAVGGSIANINAVKADLTNINNVASDLTNIDNASDYADLAQDWANKMDGSVDGTEYSAKYYAQQASQGQIQANWNETDTTSKAYIQNKPTIPTAISDLTDDSKFVINKATGTDSLTIFGTAASANNAINIGASTSMAGATGSVAIGATTTVNSSNAVAIGYGSKVGSSSTNAVAVGSAAQVSASTNNAIQLGKGTNSTANSLCIGFNGTNYQLLDGSTGLIPDARISSNIARTSALSAYQETLVSGTNIKTINNNSILGNGNLVLDGLPSQSGNNGKFLTTDGTDASWATVTMPTIDQTYDDTSTNAQSGVAIAGAGFINSDDLEQVECVIETYSSGTSWYRVWSDGWCEQGGKFVITTASVSGGTYNTATLTFLKPFNECITYNVQAKHDRFNAGFETVVSGQALNQVTVYQVNDGGASFANPYVIWQACGYITLGA